MFQHRHFWHQIEALLFFRGIICVLVPFRKRVSESYRHRQQYGIRYIRSGTIFQAENRNASKIEM